MYTAIHSTTNREWTRTCTKFWIKDLNRSQCEGVHLASVKALGLPWLGFDSPQTADSYVPTRNQYQSAPAPAYKKKKGDLLYRWEKKEKCRFCCPQQSFPEKGPTWTMLFLAATTPLLTARGLKRYLWFKLQARTKPQKRGEKGWKHFKSWENCPVFSSAGNLSKHLSSVES